MTRFSRYAWLLVIGLFTLAAGFTANRLAEGNDKALTSASQQLELTPKQFADWVMQSESELSAGDASMLQCRGNVCRMYKNRVTGQIVNMFIIVGPPGPTSVHNPEICYSSKGYQAAESAERITVKHNSKADSLWAVVLKSERPTSEALAVAYGWNAGNGWIAADNPRFEFGGKPFLYKMQLATTVDLESATASDACQRFLNDFLPALDATLPNSSSL